MFHRLTGNKCSVQEINVNVKCWVFLLVPGLRNPGYVTALVSILTHIIVHLLVWENGKIYYNDVHTTASTGAIEIESERFPLPPTKKTQYIFFFFPLCCFPVYWSRTPNKLYSYIYFRTRVYRNSVNAVRQFSGRNLVAKVEEMCRRRRWIMSSRKCNWNISSFWISPHKSMYNFQILSTKKNPPVVLLKRTIRSFPVWKLGVTLTYWK